MTIEVNLEDNLKLSLKDNLDIFAGTFFILELNIILIILSN